MGFGKRRMCGSADVATGKKAEVDAEEHPPFTIVRSQAHRPISGRSACRWPDDIPVA